MRRHEGGGLQLAWGDRGGPEVGKKARGLEGGPRAQGSLRDRQGRLLQPPGRRDRPGGSERCPPRTPVAVEAGVARTAPCIQGGGSDGAFGEALSPEAGPGATSPWKPLS